jgi:hypothetical protein
MAAHGDGSYGILSGAVQVPSMQSKHFKWFVFDRMELLFLFVNFEPRVIFHT